MVFTNVKRVVIRNKEVKSIVLSNGAILYDGHDYTIDLTTSKNNLNGSNNETATLTATVLDKNEPVPNKMVLFYDGNVYMNPLIDNNNDFTAVYGDGYGVNNGMVVGYGDRIVHNQLLDMTTDSFVISFKCTASQGSSYAICGNFTTSIGGEQYYTNFNIRNDGYIDFFNAGYNLPSGLWGGTLEIKMIIAPNQQDLYINNIFVGTSTVDLSQKCNASNNYMNLFLFGQDDEFTISDLGIVTNNSGVVYGFAETDNNGEASITFVSDDTGQFPVTSECLGETDTITITVV